MQHRITQPSKLLNQRGELIQKGYALSPILKYCRKDVAAKLRLKEWDYYLIYNKKYAVALTIGSSVNLLFISITMLNLKNKKELSKSFLRYVSKKTFQMPEAPDKGDIIYRDPKLNLAIKHVNKLRYLSLYIEHFVAFSDLDISFVLSKEPRDSIVTATPFYESKTAFYYNQKTIGFQAKGTVCCRDKTYSFDASDSLALLDWGRGVWPYKTTWYWSVGLGMVSGNLFGFNLGYGFGITSAATENTLFFNGIASKLENVVFHIPKNERHEYEYMKPWIITSSDHRLTLKFVPIYDRNVNLSAILLSTEQHQVFGEFTGVAMLDDGSVIYINNFFGFAERVENRW